MSVFSSAIKKLRRLFVNAILFDGAYEYLTSISQFELRANAEDRTLDLGMGFNGVVQQVGMELFYDPVTNRTGTMLYNGTVVMVNPSNTVQGNRFNVIKAIADGSLDGMLVIGMLTMDIEHNQTGLSTHFGNVRNLNVNELEAYGLKDPLEVWAESNILWVNPLLHGGLTNAEPDAPNLKIPCAVIKKAVGNVITVFVRFEKNIRLRDLTDIKNYDSSLLIDKSLIQWNEAGKYFEVKEPYESGYLPIESMQLSDSLSGWIDGNNIVVSYNHSTRKITLTGDLSYLYQGKKHSLISPWTSDAHAATEGSWFLSSRDGETFIWTYNTPWQFNDIMASYVNYRSLAINSFAIKETHGLMDWKSHEEFHTQIGTYRVSGGDVTARTYAISSPTDNDITPGFNQAIVKDEDVTTIIPEWTQGTYTLMHIGVGNTSVFNTASSFPIIATVGTFIQINDPATGSLTAGINNRFYNVYQILMPVTSDSDSQKYRMIILQPQVEYLSLNEAESEDVRGLQLGELTTMSPEFTVYARLTYYTLSGYTNTGKCALESITYNIGNRVGQVSISGLSSVNHAALTNLAWTSSNHSGDANKLAGFDASGLPVYKDFLSHNSLTGLNLADYLHLTAAQLALLNALNAVSANTIPIKTTTSWGNSPITLVDGNLNISGIIKTRTSKIDGIVGGTTLLATMPISLGYGAIVDYVVLSTSNIPLKTGTIQIVFSTATTKNSNGGTEDNGSTTEYITFTTVISGTDCLLRALVTSGTYNIVLSIRIL